MNIAPEHLARIQDYGYSRTQAQFLYLVATHSGYFTQRQFLRFADVKKGGCVSRFAEKLLRLRHGRTTRYGHQTFIYNLHSQLIYELIEKDNLRNHRRLSNDPIRTRLMILDFVLDHLHNQYLETAAHKFAFFHRELSVPLAVLPGRIYKGINSNCHAMHYFVDRFPIFIPCDPGSQPLPAAPTFVYCDSGGPGLLRFIRHLRTYENLLNHLTAFHFIYAAPTDSKFKRAARFFALRFCLDNQLDTERLIRYFEVRQLWESHQTGSLTRADRQLLREGDRRFQGPTFEETYQQWTRTRLSRSDLNEVFEEAKTRRNKVFSTCILPDSHNLFERISKEHSISRTLSRKETEVRSSPSPLLRLCGVNLSNDVEGE